MFLSSFFCFGNNFSNSCRPTLIYWGASVSLFLAQRAEERKSFRPLITAFKTRSSAAQFSNAVESAHRIGITGKGVSVVVAEEVTSEDSKKLAKPESLVAISTVTNSHGLHVSGIVQQLAPDASLRIGHINFNPASPLDSVEEPSEFRSAEIVNASFGPAHMDVIPSSLRQILKSGRLVVQSAGNEGISFDLPKSDVTRNKDQNYLTTLPYGPKGRLILVGNLKAGNSINPSSNFPGNSSLQENFLWTLGSDVLSHSSPTPFEEKSGTSMAAPVVTGAAALVKSLVPSFTPEELRECLLESADRDFWIQQNDTSIHVVAPGKQANAKKSSDGSIEWSFNPHVFGRGVLNVRRALIYAYIKREYKSTPKVIRAFIDFNEQLRERRAASTIKKWRAKTLEKRKADELRKN